VEGLNRGQGIIRSGAFKTTPVPTDRDTESDNDIRDCSGVNTERTKSTDFPRVVLSSSRFVPFEPAN